VLVGSGMSQGSPVFDIAIVGAGPAGSALALCLARAGARVALIERLRERLFRVGETLPPGVAARLQRLGIWDAFVASRPRAADHMLSSWGSSELQSQSFITNPYQCGWQIDRARFDELLMQAAIDAGAVLRVGCRVRALDGDGAVGWRLQLDGASEATLRARWLVDASGRTARIAFRLGIDRLRIDNLIGVALLFATDGQHGPHGPMIEAARDGWWYSACLPGNKELAVFMTDADLCQGAGKDMTKFALDQMAAAPHTARRMQDLRLQLRASVWPAASQRLACAAGAGWLAVGDAALARDPLSSSGIDFALASAALACQTLVAAHSGDDTAAVCYAAAIARDFTAYCAMRDRFYGLEQRWPGVPFWARRVHSGHSPGASSR
jgi:flavin-dependent dehydrogenase